jgi:hypothetical protein
MTTIVIAFYVIASAAKQSAFNADEGIASTPVGSRNDHHMQKIGGDPGIVSEITA